MSPKQVLFQRTTARTTARRTTERPWYRFEHLVALLACSAGLACAPAVPTPTADPRSNATTATTPPAPRTLVMATRNEPDTLAEALGGGLNLASPIRLFNAGLAIVDARGVSHAYLAEGLPTLNSASWTVAPDGTMETTYKLRANLTWHDGTPLTPKDFVFAWRVYAIPQLGVATSAPNAHIDSVVAVDDRTVLIKWKRPYPKADALTGAQGGFLPLPRHILERQLDPSTPEAFASLSFWSRDYVGLGPYRLDRWEPGGFIEAAAFADHVLGRPKIDRIRIEFIPDPNTVLANLLAGTVQLADDSSLGFSQAAVIKREWEPNRAGSVLLSPSLLRMVQVQLKPDTVNPRAMLDLRVRQALASAIDKAALSEGLFEGQGIDASSLVVPNVSYYDAVDPAVTKYPYDPRRSEELMSQAGFAKRGEAFVSESSERFSPEAWFIAGGDNEKEFTIVADGWRQAGFDVRPRGLSSAQNLDYQLKASFPAVLNTAVGVGEAAYRHLSTSGMPTAANNWRGGVNQGGWSNPEYDRLLDSFNTTLDRDQQVQQVAQMMKLVSEELPWIPMYFRLRVVAHTSALTGPQPTAPESVNFDNVHQWEMR